MISILIPIYNGIEFIKESVMSVIHQTSSQWELLIGVNGHPENSDVYQIAKEYEKKSSNIRVFDFYTIKGKSNTLNKMIEYCNYDYIALLDVDDIWVSTKLEKQLPYLNKYDVIGSQCICFSHNNFEERSPKIPIGDLSSFNFLSVNPIINSSCIIRKSLCSWNYEFDSVEDYELWLSLWKQKYMFFNVENILVKHRIHRQSIFNSSENQKIQLRKLLSIYQSK